MLRNPEISNPIRAELTEHLQSLDLNLINFQKRLLPKDTFWENNLRIDKNGIRRDRSSNCRRLWRKSFSGGDGKVRKPKISIWKNELNFRSKDALQRAQCGHSA
jgi:hypothetical protein